MHREVRYGMVSVTACVTVFELLGLTAQAAVPQPFCESEGEEHQAEGEAHESDHEDEPSGVCVRAIAANASEDGLREERGDDSGDQRPDASGEKSARSFVVRPIRTCGPCGSGWPSWLGYRLLHERSHFAYRNAPASIARTTTPVTET